MNELINTFITDLNKLGTGFWNYATEIFVQSSVLIIFLLVLDFLLRKRVRAVFRYCLWMLLFVKLALPASFTLPTGIGYWLGDYFPRTVSGTKSVPLVEEIVPMFVNIPQERTFHETPVMNGTTPAAVELESVSWQSLIFLCWVLGIVILSILVARRFYYVRRLIVNSRPANERSVELLGECRCRMGIRRNIELRLTGNKLSPAVCGLFRPVILVPAALLTKLSREKLKTVLIHELAHVKRGDAWINLLQTILQIVYFYNPLIWLANAMIRRVREQAVDETVLVTLSPETKNYSNMLIDIAEMAFWRPNFSLNIIGVIESKKALERRINHMLTRPVPKSSKIGYIGLFAIVVIGAILLPMGRNTTANAADQKAYIPPTSIINAEGCIVDKIDYPFVNDPLLIGTWKSVDFVSEMEQFKAGEKQWEGSGGELYLKGLVFLPNGKTFRPWWTWTKGLVFHSGDKTAAKYTLKDIDGSTYMFFEWKSGDYTIRHRKPAYYVLKKVSSETVNYESIVGEIADIPPTSTINEQGHVVDKTDYPFVNDPEVLGGWKSVDFVREIDQFNPAQKNWKGDLFLNHLVFEEGGKITGKILKWTKGLVLSDDTASKYIIREIDGSTYMFFEWKSGDYTVRRMKPSYYVLKKVSAESLKHEPMFGKKADIPSTSKINEDGRIVDKIDYPFVNDPRIIGTWKSVDFVGEMEDFKASEKNWKGDLYLKELIFLPNGRTFKPWWTWTKGLVFHSGDRTAAKYTIKDIEGSTYMFFEWKSGDYIFRYRKPSYYVLKKVSSETGDLADAWASQPSDAEFARQLPAKIKQLDIDTADLEQVKKIFGKPAQYIWGKDTFTEDDLPERYILVYPSQFCVFMSNNKIVEIRHESGFKYVFRDILRSGSTLDEVLEVIGRPNIIVEGEKNSFKDGVLYKDIDGRKGHCYYARSDQDVRFWFLDYKLIAIYMTRSDY